MAHSNATVELWVVGALLDADGPLLRATARELIERSGIAADDFTHPLARVAFGAIRAGAEKQVPTNARTVFAATRGMAGVQESALEALLALQAENSCTREALSTHASELRRLSRLRRLERFLRSSLAQLEQAERPDPVKLAASLDTFAADFCASTEVDETGDIDMHELVSDWYAVAEGRRVAYLPTGIEALDQEIGGFVPNLNIVGGMPSVGKSALIGEVVMSCLERGIRVGLFGLEDATKWLTKRHLARAMGMPVGAVAATRLHEHQQDALAHHAGRIADLTKNLVVYRRAGISAEDVVQRSKHWVMNLGVQAVFIDHGGEVQHEAKQRDRYDLAVAGTYRALRDLAVNHKVPVVVLAHFNRDTETNRGGVPSMQSFAETEYIARMARLALGLWQKPGDSSLRCTVLKRTEGERGITIGLERDHEHALVKRTGGSRIDLDAEREAEQKARQTNKGQPWAKTQTS